MTAESTAADFKGIPLRERDPEHVTQALRNAEEETVAAFVRLLGYAKTHHLGLSALALQTNIPATCLSQCFNGIYTDRGGDVNAIAERIRTFFWRLEQKEKYGGLRQFCETRLVKTMWALFEKIRIIRRIQILQSPEQLGKTRAAVEYTARNNSRRTVYVQLSGGSKSGCGDFIWELAARLDIPAYIKTREKRLRIKECLASCDLIIIDEAHLIFTWTPASQAEFWDYLRTDIFDNGARGVVLIATNSDMLQCIREFRHKARYNIGQLLGRMRLDPIELDPAEDICEADVAALVSRYYEPGKRTLQMLVEIARKPQLGHYGLLEDIMNEAWTRAKSRGKKAPDDAVVEKVAEEIMSALKQRKELYQ